MSTNEKSSSLAYDTGVSTTIFAPAGDGLAVSLIDDRQRYSLRLRDDNVAAFEEASGQKLPRSIGAEVIWPDGVVFRLGPDEYFIRSLAGPSKHLLENLERALAPMPHSLVDISHRNLGIEINGEAAANFINIGCPLDLSVDAFPVGKVTRTVFERAEIILRRVDAKAFEIEIWRSFAPYLMGMIAKGV